MKFSACDFWKAATCPYASSVCMYYICVTENVETIVHIVECCVYVYNKLLSLKAEYIIDSY